MAIPDERKVALSIPTQTAMKGLRDAARISICRTATNATFSKLISQVFEISALGSREKSSSRRNGFAVIAGGASLFGEPRRMILWRVLRGAQGRAPQDDGTLSD
jgi:hypothetical protein